MNNRKSILIILSPPLLVMAVISTFVGFAYVGGTDLALSISNSINSDISEAQKLGLVATRCLLVPFQLVFVALVLWAGLALYRRRWRFSSFAFEPLRSDAVSVEVREQFDPLRDDWDILVKVRPERQLTLTHIVSSLIGVVIIITAAVLIVGQFVSLTDLAIVVTALTGALAWGARLPVSDVLGGIGNLFEDNFNVGDRLSYRHFKLDVEGDVEGVNLRFAWLRGTSGELITIPFGEIRTFRNFSRSTFAGVYVSFPIPSTSIEPAIATLEAMAPESPLLIPDLLEPWRVVSQDGALGSTVELSLYGRAPVGREQELQLAMHELVWNQLQTLNLVTAPEEIT